ncbi:RDD family protein [Amphritea pacifica]|uniref:RDD family protein n=1 Tax=Amphritea pacifica TaxID=2811233 RepID=A0ABS2W404_9GAMM|nr:RDD family protein [Amphritea pacifica]MBN0986449.1 RDD family protein [Amphritea pacifica]MBN1008181.1 RDD family protein [Amphritea pacifica]
METVQSPYAAPQSDLTLPAEETIPVAASKMRRFLNYLIDIILMQVVFGFLIGVAAMLLFGNAGLDYIDSIPDYLFGVTVMVIYYLIFEGFFGVTIGKLVTGTRIVSETGLPPAFGQILGRTFLRIVPFEPFSFLGKTGRGWHDTVSNTYVICIREPEKKRSENVESKIAPTPDQSSDVVESPTGR